MLKRWGIPVAPFLVVGMPAPGALADITSYAEPVVETTPETVTPAHCIEAL